MRVKTFSCKRCFFFGLKLDTLRLDLPIYPRQDHSMELWARNLEEAFAPWVFYGCWEGAAKFESIFLGAKNGADA